jgi:hypothetical protein
VVNDLDFQRAKNAVAAAQVERAMEVRGDILRRYKDEITDWCGHDLACELVAQKTGVSEATVRAIVCDAGNIWS